MHVHICACTHTCLGQQNIHMTIHTHVHTQNGRAYTHTPREAEHTHEHIHTRTHPGQQSTHTHVWGSRAHTFSYTHTHTKGRRDIPGGGRGLFSPYPQSLVYKSPCQPEPGWAAEPGTHEQGRTLQNACGKPTAAKSLQSCLTLCDPIDGSPPGSPRPWDSPGKNTGVGCHFPLQCMKVKSESEVVR